MKKTLSIFALIIMGLGLFAQEAETAAKPKPTLDELRDSISKIVNDFFDEILDFEVAEAALQARQISNVGYGLDNALFQNGELRDTFEVLRQVLQSELFIKAAVHYDHFWTRLIERSNYSPRDAELENRYGDGLYDNRIYFDVVFTPAWDTLKMDVDAAREVGSIAWECSIDLHGVGTFRAEFSDKEMAQLAGEPVSGHKYGNIGTGAKPDVNMGVMGSLGWLAEKFGYSPADDTTNVRYVRFYAPNANDRTFDAPGNALLGGNYDNTPVEGRKYLAPWQSAAGNAQTLYAHVERKDKKNGTGDTLNFKTTAGAPVSAERLNDTTYRLSLPGLAAMGGQGIQATYSYTGSDGREKAVFAGQVNIAENKAQKMDLVLVEVNGNTLGEPAKAVQDTLNAIYKPAGVTWTVRKEPLRVKSKAADTDNLDDGETQLLTNYTGDMDAVIDAYRKVYGKPDKNTCYLFLVGKAQSGTGKCGYMPLKRQFGFIFTQSACGSKGELKRTVAHELGHGPFRLYHTFSAHSQYVQPEGETDNLMDYSNGTRTRKYQWDLIHDPESMIALFQDEEEAEMVDRVATLITAMQEANNNAPGTTIELPWYGGTSSMEGTVKIGGDEIDCEILPKSKDYISGNKIKYTVPDFTDYYTRQGGTTERHYTCDGYRISFKQFTIKVKPPAIRMYDYDWLKEQTYRVRNYINNNAAALSIDYIAKVREYNNRYSAAGTEEAKKEVVKEFLEEDIYSKYYTGLSVDLRVAGIKGVMDIKHLHIEINDQEEQEILFLLDNINDRDISSFLKKLETEKYKGKSLAIKMLEDFQDAVTVAEVFGTQRDYYTSLLQIFIELSVKDQARLKKLESYNANNTIKLNMVPWWQGASYKDFNYKLELTETKVQLQEECYLPTGAKVQRYNSQGLPLAGVYDYVYKWYQSNIQQEYSPFDLLVLDDRSNLSSDILERIYSGETVLDGLKVMPAAAMHYIKQKRRNQTVEELSYISVDVLAMAVGVGELALAAKAISNSRKVVVVIDIMNSAANIAVNTTELQNDENVQKWLQIYNAATVFNNLAASYKGGKNLIVTGTNTFANRLNDLGLSKLVNKLDNLDNLTKSRFIDDFADAADNTLSALNKNEKLVDSWETIKYCGDDELAKLATNIDELDVVAKNIDDIDAAGGYKAWKDVIKKFDDYVQSLKTKVNPRKDLPDGVFERKATGNDIQYEAVGGGEKIWADGVDNSKRALLDAKHNPGDFYTLDSYNKKPFMYGDLEDEFRRYGKIISDKSNPTEELVIIISRESENSVALFEHLATTYNVPIKVELVPWTP